MWGYAPEAVLNRPLLEGVPELEGQGFDTLIGKVFTTGVPYAGRETPARLLRNGKPETSYYNFVFQPVYDGLGRITGVLDVVTEVTDLVTARRQVQQLNEELAAANGELKATNEELIATIEELHLAKEALEEINTSLEARVEERTREAQDARAEAQAQRAQLQRVFEQAPVAIAIYRGPQLVIELANPAIGQLWGRPVAPLLGRPLFEALPDARGQGFEELFADLFSSGVARSFLETPVTLVRKPGGAPTPGYYNFTYQPLPETATQPAGLIAVGIDVTGQVLARQEREAQQRKLYTLFEQAPAGICILAGPDLVYEFLNPGYQELLPGRKLLGRPILEALPELAGTDVEALLRRVYETGETRQVQDLLIAVARPGGGQLEDRYFTFVYQARRDGQGLVNGILAFVFEVTGQVLARRQAESLNHELATANRELAATSEELAAANEELRAANEEIQASNEELAESNGQLLRTNVDLDNFIYTASHDLKAPISNIEGLLKALLRSLPAESLASERVQGITGMMQSSVERFKKTIANLTEVVKLQKEHSGEVCLIDLQKLIGEVVLDLASLISESDTQLQVDLTGCPAIRFSEKNLRSVIYNLLSNAIKYRSPERTPQVKIHCALTSGYCVLSVTDNGLGMDPQRISQLFTMFKRFHDHVEGTGIGLYMVKKMVENAGGRIQVESRVGEGSVFTVFFPR
jgi:signal transduction histidine kinase